VLIARQKVYTPIYSLRFNFELFEGYWLIQRVDTEGEEGEGGPLEQNCQRPEGDLDLIGEITSTVKDLTLWWGAEQMASSFALLKLEMIELD
jgi:hypothetical protein